MKCSICGEAIRTDVCLDHCKQAYPITPSMCMGCWVAQTQLEMFLLRATSEQAEGGRTIMGNWTEGWLKEILANPRKHL